MFKSRDARPWIVRAIFFLAVQLVLVTVLLLPRNTLPAYAAGRYVDHILGTDSGACLSLPGCQTLGYAISQSNDGDSITIAGHLTPDVFTENLMINKSLSLIGTSANPSLIVIDGNGNVTNQRVMMVSSGATVSLVGMTIRNGRLSGVAGAGIWNQGTLIIDTVVITGNQAIGITSNDVGGGITNDGILTVTNSTIGHNLAQRGGGIFNAGAAAMVLFNTQVIGNQANSGGGLYNYGDTAQFTDVTVGGNTTTGIAGGIYNESGKVMTLSNSTISNNIAMSVGGIYNGGTITMTNVMVSGNRATAGSSGGLRNDSSISLNNVTFNLNSATSPGGALTNQSGTFTIQNSIVANNVGGNCNLVAPIVSGGYNLSSDTTCSAGLTNTGDLNNTNPRLSTLANNGGNTKTHGLFIGSPAINAGNPAASDDTGNHCRSTDQRGVSRRVGRCDIGAFEGWLYYQLYVPLIVR